MNERRCLDDRSPTNAPTGSYVKTMATTRSVTRAEGHLSERDQSQQTLALPPVTLTDDGTLHWSTVELSACHDLDTDTRAHSIDPSVDNCRACNLRTGE